MVEDKVSVSAPGKVLLTGAYLVLEKPNAGLVLSTSARFFATAKNTLDSARVARKYLQNEICVKVISPQLKRDTTYFLQIPSLSIRREDENSGSNQFVENAIQLSLAAALRGFQESRAKAQTSVSSLIGHCIELTLLGSNSFYSYRRQLQEKGLPLTSTSLKIIPPFSDLTRNDSSSISSTNAPEVAKTGLGSSAAMTTAAVGALLQLLGAVDLHGDQKAMDLVHRVSQAAHCAAQGKVGSGFDVSAAVFGSQRYVRFSPQVLSPAMEALVGGSPGKAVENILGSPWDDSHVPWALPPGFFLMVGEPGAGGSSTPSMVGAVQIWRKGQADVASKVWSSLAAANQRVEEGLKDLSALSQQLPETYARTVDLCMAARAPEWIELGRSFPEGAQVVFKLSAVREAFGEVRRLLQEMGQRANVPIEPSVQTDLLNATVELPGVLFAGVPGAGGYDAIFAVVLGESAREAVEQVWCQRGVLTLDVEEDPMGVKLEMDFCL